MIHIFLACFFGLGAITAILFIIVSMGSEDGVLSFFWFLIMILMMILMIDSVNFYYENAYNDFIPTSAKGN